MAEPMELMNTEISSLFSKQDIETLIKFEELQVKVNEIKKGREDKLKEIFEKYGIKSFENEDLKITYIEPTTRKQVDTNALKEQGLYDSFLKETPVKSSIRISIKYED